MSYCLKEIMRVRKVVTRSGRGMRGKFPSRKLGQHVHWESTRERDAILMFELHPLVLSYQEQPSADTYYDDEGTAHTCYPDFLLRTVGGKELLIEVKRSADLARPSIKRKLALIAMRYAELGRTYRVITEHEIRREPLHGNLQLLWEALRAMVIPPAAHRAVGELSPQRVYTVADLVPLLGDEKTVYAFIALGRLRTNLEARLNRASPVWTLENTEAGDGAFSI